MCAFARRLAPPIAARLYPYPPPPLRARFTTPVGTPLVGSAVLLPAPLVSTQTILADYINHLQRFGRMSGESERVGTYGLRLHSSTTLI